MKLKFFDYQKEIKGLSPKRDDITPFQNLKILEKLTKEKFLIEFLRFPPNFRILDLVGSFLCGHFTHQKNPRKGKSDHFQKPHDGFLLNIIPGKDF